MPVRTPKRFSGEAAQQSGAFCGGRARASEVFARCHWSGMLRGVFQLESIEMLPGGHPGSVRYMLKEGDPAPRFDLPDAEMETIPVGFTINPAMETSPPVLVIVILG